MTVLSHWALVKRCWISGVRGTSHHGSGAHGVPPSLLLKALLPKQGSKMRRDLPKFRPTGFQMTEGKKRGKSKENVTRAPPHGQSSAHGSESPSFHPTQRVHSSGCASTKETHTRAPREKAEEIHSSTKAVTHSHNWPACI